MSFLKFITSMIWVFVGFAIYHTYAESPLTELFSSMYWSFFGGAFIWYKTKLATGE